MYKFYDGPMYFAPTPKGDGTFTYNKSSPDAPDAPDYKGAAEATAASDMEAVRYQTNANRANQYTPWGSLTWSRTPGSGGTASTFDQARYDADMAKYNSDRDAWSEQQYMGGGNATRYGESDMGGMYSPSGSQQYMGVAPNRDDYWSKATADDGGGWEQRMNLTPEAQAALDSYMRVQKNQMGLAEGLQAQVAEMMKTGFVGPELADYMKNVGTVSDFQYNGDPTPKFNEQWRQQGIDAAYKYSTALTDPAMAGREKTQDTQLRLQGLVPGSEAYNNAMQNLFATNNRARQDAANAAIMYGDQMANNDFASALAGQQNQYNQAFQTWKGNVGAQDQRFQQANTGYQTAYTAALQKYLQPLNNMNAVIHGNQVQQPTFPSYMGANRGQATDYAGAESALGSWNQGVYNRDAANAQSGNNATAAGVGAIAAAFMA